MAQPQTTIVGAGIIGLATAYHLSQSKRTPATSIRILDPSPALHFSASGNAGGFLARDWFSPATAALGEFSFDLHTQLAEENGGREKWGWSWSTGTSLSDAASGRNGDAWCREGGSRAEAASGLDPGVNELWSEDGPGWLVRKDGEGLAVISEKGTVAQVDPRRLCEWLLAQIEEAGVKIHWGATALRVEADTRDELAAIRIAEASGEEVDLPCTRLVITAGAWSERVFKTLFPSSDVKLGVRSLAGHSLVLRTGKWSTAHEAKGCHAVFATDVDGFSPEVFSRLGEEIYIAGLNDMELELPDRAANAQIDPVCIQRLKKVAEGMMGNEDLQVAREALCFRPITVRGAPILSRVADTKLGGLTTRGKGEGGVFISAGHGPWGISHSLGTGKLLAELIEGETPSVNISGLML